MFTSIFNNLTSSTPLVHCITNYVTVNDCANIVLACGGAPIMADDIAEAAEITSICNTLVINIGTLNARTIDSMIAAGKQANALGHPVILDPVGAGASTLRTETVFRLLKEVKFSVIRGNISEIKTVHQGSGSTKGVDADVSDVVSKDNLQEVISFAQALSAKTGAVIAITGAIDLIVNTEKAYVLYNGHPDMSKITGTGCMLTAMIGAFCGANPTQPLEATTAAVSTMGISGEQARETMSGFASYKVQIMDLVSQMTAEKIKEAIRFELF